MGSSKIGSKNLKKCFAAAAAEHTLETRFARHSTPRTMKYKSTRGGCPSVGFEAAICSGYAPDGGLYVPEQIPTVSAAMLQKWSTLPFAELAVQVLALFVGDEIPAAYMRAICAASFSQFTDPGVVPVVKVGALHVAELFHGPTLAFKDFGQQVLCKMLDFFAVRANRDITLVVSTTGDTGPAAIRATAGSRRLRILCTYPTGQVSRLQEQQMTTVDSPSVRVFTFEGGGDDMDGPIKRVTTDPAFTARHGLTSVNSINLGRVTVQTVHFFFSYFRTIEQVPGAQVGDEITFCVPTGAMGNVTAGHMARLMGLPMAQLCSGVNANDIVHRAFSKGQFWKESMHRTLSEAINIQVPYNFERLLFFICDFDSGTVAGLMAGLEATGKLTLPPPTLRKLQTLFSSAVVSDDEMKDTVRQLKAAHGYLVDPHSAVGVACATKLGWRHDDAASVARAPGKAVLVLATAHVCKFEHAMCEALGRDFWESVELPESARALDSLPDVGGRPAGKVFLAGDKLDEVGVSLHAAAGGAWERQLRGLIDGSVEGGFGPPPPQTWMHWLRSKL